MQPREAVLLEPGETIESALQRYQDKDLLRFLTAGSVDDGKSTLIGRLLYDANLLYEDQLSAVEKDSLKKGHAGGDIDLSLLTDGLKAEREQGITIDVAYRYFTTARRKFIIADTPGHEQYTRNMATGASNCDLAIILIDARSGVLSQTRRHSYIASLLGIKHLVVAINKMDLVDYSQQVFETIRADYTRFAAQLGVSDVAFIPLSALKGDNVVQRTENMPWYQGPPMLSYLEGVHIAGDRNLTDFRFPVQMVIRPDLTFRGFAGTIASGVVRRGEEVAVLPSGKLSRVRSIVTWDGELEEACAPQAVTLTLEHEVDISRGDMLVHPHNQPHHDRDLEAMVVWMDQKPMTIGASYWIKHSTNIVPATLGEISYWVDINTLDHYETEELHLNEIGCVRLTLSRPIFYDPYKLNRYTGSIIVIDRLTNVTVGAGMILAPQPRTVIASKQMAAVTFVPHKSEITPEMRARVLEQKAVTIWITGLPKSGKTPIAYGLEKRLFAVGRVAYVIEGTAMRTHISTDLAFGADDRTENARRLAEMARFMTDAGLITICASVSPYRSDRQKARYIVGDDRFLEIYCNAPADVCARHDTEGVYERARRGEIKNFTGVSAPYEPPEKPDLMLNTDEAPIDTLVDRLLELLRSKGFLG